jgi:tetratricopeptide (TPR) repeat protein
LQAGLMPRLGEANFQGVYVKLGDRDPISLIRKALAAPEGEAFVPMLENAVGRAGKPIVLILDQFEQFFVQFQEADRATFIDALKSWYESDVTVKVLIGIRGDLSDRLVGIQKALGYSLRPTQVYRLEKFAPEQATNVLRVIAETEGLAFNQQFVLEVARDELAGPDGKVSPVDVQILAQMISREANEANRTFDKQAFQKLGGVDGLLGRSLKRSLDTILSKAEQERTLEVLLALTDLERNVRAGQFSLAQLQKLPGKVRGGPLEVVTAVQWLMEARLITPVEQEGNVAYELAHERLIPALRQVANQELSAVNRANMLLEQRVNEWLGSGKKRRYLFGLGELRLLRQQRGFLEWGQRESQKRELLRRSWWRGGRNLGLLSAPVFCGAAFGVWSHTPPGQLQWARWDLMMMSQFGNPLTSDGSITSDPSNLYAALNLDILAGVKNNPAPSFWIKWFVLERYNTNYNNIHSEVIKITANTKDRDVAKRLLHEVHLASSAPKDFSVKAVLLAQVAEGYINLQDQAKAQEVLSQALEAAKSIKEEYSKVYALSAIAGAYGKLNDSSKAQQVLSEALEVTKSIKEESSKSSALSAIAGAYGKLNDSSKAQQGLSEALEVTKSIKEESSKSNALSAIAGVYGKLNDSSKAQQVLSEALEVTKSIKDNKYSKVYALSVIAGAYGKLNDSSKAQQGLSEALEVTKSIKDESYKSNALSVIAGVYGKLNDSSKAQQGLSEALEVTKSIKDESSKSIALSAIAQAYLKLNDVEKAKATLSDAAKSAEIAKFSSSTSQVAQVYAELGNWGEALRLSRRCYVNEKVAVLARILRVHAEQVNPEFKALRDVKPDEDGDIEIVRAGG